MIVEYEKNAMRLLFLPGSGGRSRSAPTPPTAIRIACRLNEPPERVFDAWLDPEIAGRWLFATAWRPMTEVDIDPRVGGSFRFAQARDGVHSVHTGHYLELVPNQRLVFTLVTADRERIVTKVTASIHPQQTGCELAVVHENLPPDRAGEIEARWAGMLYGLEETLSAHP